MPDGWKKKDAKHGVKQSKVMDNIVEFVDIDKKDKQDIHDAILTLQVMPSMRALMTAGAASDGTTHVYITVATCL